MIKNILLLLILFCSCGYISAQNKTTKTKVIIKDPYSENPFLDVADNGQSDNVVALVDSIKTLLFADSLFTNSFSELKKGGMRIVESEDKQIRILSWKTPVEDDFCLYHNIIQYKVAAGKTRCVYFGNSSYDDYKYSQPYGNYINNLDMPHNMEVSKIYFLKKGIYIIEGIETHEHKKEYKLVATDIGRGLIKEAYVFSGEENAPISSLTLSVYNGCIEDERFILDDWHLQIPQADENGCVTSIYTDYFFNGAFFVNSEKYQSQLPFIEERKDLIARLYFKDGENSKVITTIPYASMNISLIADITRAKRNDLKDMSYGITLQSTEEYEHESGELFNYKVALRPIDNSVFIESVTPYYLPINKIDTTRNDNLLKVIYSAGKEKALTYEWLRYTAVAFNCILSEDDVNRIKWGIEIDGGFQLLDEEEYQGTQIDLQMKEEWANKEILVIPYIKDSEIDKEVGIRTLVLAD